ncbi:hypothetical protein EMIHUDRAFT_219861 [Emiliania huxleyi CCMP1516]|uniref:SET domain-containing protein n=2 Tax=Emiliania huxleyi TaxID=2903 RepID=A0A0D3I3E0_EMIH1|nr:hypothetical protein EMIHUDRAFT_219861 [Emiliania huxleyi CCMP1516]EOD05775.1 hypothetical protein EMIHUDRAFT_219861 [Emiliania huxleyi CCMP1516]|eukprot:XP_005758204.1 hypothetical protein EMIHUDRAFT_219861 [Emiliania huxleyi CCMP1516]
MRIFAERDGVSIAPSPGKGHGVFAARHIPAEVSVGDYAGDILSQRDVEVRYEAAPRAHALWCEADEAWLRRRGALGIGCSGDYIFRVGDDTFVDSEEYATANWTRFLNHGADANLRVKSLLKGMDGRPRVWFQALRDIEPGEELLWDYGESYWRASDVLYQYWGYAWVYAATIANATFAVRDTGKSAYELKTGQRPKMNMFYPWACKMIVKSPPHLVANGVSPTGEMAAFLGILSNYMSRHPPG